MQSRKNYRIILFVALTLSLGVITANLPFVNTTVAGAPTPPLTSVAHDATLAGAGTTAAPLGVASGGIGTSQLASSAVSSLNIALGAVGGSQLANGAVTSTKLGLSAVGTAQIADGAVTASKIGSGQVVKSLNSLTDNIVLAAGSNITITPSGNTLTIDANPPAPTPQPYINPLRVATLQWYDANQTGLTYAAGTIPLGIAFDGANMWITNQNANSVTKRRANDGANLGTFAVGSLPNAIAFDGANMWVVNLGSSTVTKLRASDGANLGTFSLGGNPFGIAFDGANIWVANSTSNTITKLRASDGANLGTFGVGTTPLGIAIDGANIWVANGSDNSVTKL
jgi:hypothetical protein